MRLAGRHPLRVLLCSQPTAEPGLEFAYEKYLLTDGCYPCPSQGVKKEVRVAQGQVFIPLTSYFHDPKPSLLSEGGHAICSESLSLVIPLLSLIKPLSLLSSRSHFSTRTF